MFQLFCCTKPVQILQLDPYAQVHDRGTLMERYGGTRQEEPDAVASHSDATSKATSSMPFLVLPSTLLLNLLKATLSPLSMLHSVLHSIQFTGVLYYLSSTLPQTNPIELEGSHYHERVKSWWYLPPPLCAYLVDGRPRSIVLRVLLCRPSAP